MNFLNKAIFSTEGVFLGAVLTEYDSQDVCKRPATQFRTAEDLRMNYESLDCRGFHFDDGILYSDSSSLCYVTEDIADYLSDESKQSQEEIYDITDLVLFGITNGGCVLPKFSEGDRDIVVPFSKFKVSGSTFNIYAPYYVEGLGFRTCSLLNTEDQTASEFVMAMPSDIDCSNFDEMLELVELEATINGLKYNIYRAHPKLADNRVFPGEAFTNYCGFMVAHNHIGEKVIQTLYKTYGNNTPYPRDMMNRSPRSRKLGANISIEHDYFNEVYTNEVLERINRKNEIAALFKEHPAAVSSYNWIASVMRAAQNFVKDGKSTEEAILSACPILFLESREQMLIYSLELLSIRNTLHVLECTVGGVQLPAIMKGGGVNGTSFAKRASW